MRLTIFNRGKYIESIKKLQKRKAPDYVIEAYNNGYTDVVNYYYRIKLFNKINKIEESKVNLLEQFKNTKLPFITEALTKRDEEFLKAFFIMTNLDIVTGKRLPRNAGQMLKQREIVDLGLTKLHKRLR